MVWVMIVTTAKKLPILTKKTKIVMVLVMPVILVLVGAQQCVDAKESFQYIQHRIHL